MAGSAKSPNFKLAFLQPDPEIFALYMQSDATHLSPGDQLLAWFENNKRQAALSALVLALVGVAVGIYFWRQNQVQVSANNALSQAISANLHDQTAANTALLKVASDYPGTAAARRAILMAAANLFTEGQYKDAQAQFDRYLREYRDSPFAMEAVLGVAAAKEAQGMTNEAVAAYKDIVERHPNESVTPNAKFNLARLYQAQGQLELARDYYMQVAQTDPNGPLGSEASMALAELFAHNPKLIPSKPAMPVAPTAASLPAATPGTPAASEPPVTPAPVAAPATSAPSAKP